MHTLADINTPSVLAGLVFFLIFLIGLAGGNR